ncbi:MAG: HupE/UreJ family protein [Burkholderiaceae bacterium]
MNSKSIRWCIALMSVAFCGIANAHPGHGGGLMAGITHPLFGLDHVLAMVAVGVWAFQLGGRAKWLVPASFVALMAVAGGVGMAGIGLPMVEIGIAASVLILGLLVAFSVRVTPAIGAGIVALFAIFHGHAHGAEMPLLGMGSAWQYAIGFVAATAALHGLGRALGKGLNKQGLVLRASGAVVAASGVWMMAGI